MKKTIKSRRQKTTSLAVYAMLTAVILVMSFTPLGYLTVGPVKMTLIMIPVAVGAVTMGPAGGAFLGLVFGLTSFAQCFGLDPFGTTLMSLSPVYTLIMCIVPRALMGYLCGLIFKGLSKYSRKGAYIVACLSAAVLNTAFFMTFLILLFGKTEYIASFRGGLSILAFTAAFVGINGLAEIAASALIGSPVCAALDKAFKKLK